MGINLSKVILVLSIAIFLASPKLRAQEDLELELELEAQPVPAEVSAPVEAANEVTSETASEVTSETNMDLDGQDVEAIEQEYALNGYSIGALLFNHNYNVKANILINNIPVDISRKSPDFQSAGIMARYAVLPYDKIGADINISLASSMNHTSVNSSSIATLRGELNLGYAFKMGNSASVYFLAGGGYEITKGADINDILVPGGGAFQIGGGIGFGEKLDFEFIYSYVSHAISDKYLEAVAAAATIAGATSVSYNSREASVVSNVLLGRVTYNY